MRNWRRLPSHPWILLFLILTLALAACQEAAPEPTPAPTSPPATTAPEATPVTEPEPTSEPAPAEPTATPATDDGPADDPASAASEAARDALAAAENLAPEDVEVVAVEPADWSDSCLGLGGPAESCLAAITPGYEVTLSAGGETIVYRTNADASSLRREDAPGGEAEPLPASLARAALADALGLDPQAITVSDVIPRDWSDACLGLGAPDELCAAVITPGYEVVLDVAGRQVIYRTDGAGSLMLLAEASAPAPDDTVLAWQREGGIAGFCDALSLTAAGEARATTCLAETPAESGTLTPEQQASLDEWLSTYRAFTRQMSDDAVADAMTIGLVFLGAGSQTPTNAAVDEMLTFAAEIHFAQSQPAEPAPTETETPPAPTGGAWTRFLVEPLDMSFPIRSAWSRVDEAFVWTTSDGGEVRFVAAGDVTDPLSLLPAGNQIAGNAATDQGWAAGMFYRTTAPDSLGTLFGASYVLTDPDGQTFLFTAVALDATILAGLELDLGRMVGAVAFSEGEDKVSGPTQVTLDFFAAWLNGEDVDDYLSAELRDEIAAGTNLAAALGLPGENYRSFTVAWIQTSGGRSQVRATLTYDGGPQSRIVNLVQENGAWVIDGAV